MKITYGQRADRSIWVSIEEEKDGKRSHYQFDWGGTLEQIEKIAGHVADNEDNIDELVAIQNALGFNESQMFNAKHGFVNLHTKSLERIRDLIAIEGQVGDLKDALKNLLETCKKHRWKVNSDEKDTVTEGQTVLDSLQ